MKIKWFIRFFALGLIMIILQSIIILQLGLALRNEEKILLLLTDETLINNKRLIFDKTEALHGRIKKLERWR